MAVVMVSREQIQVNVINRLWYFFTDTCNSNNRLKIYIHRVSKGNTEYEIAFLDKISSLEFLSGLDAVYDAISRRDAN
jgi:hypothetical protein